MITLDLANNLTLHINVREEMVKRIVPRGIKADHDLARRISLILTQAVVEELLSAPDFVPFDGESGSPGDLLEDLAKLALEQDRDDPNSGSLA